MLVKDIMDYYSRIRQTILCYIIKCFYLTPLRFEVTEILRLYLLSFYFIIIT